MILLVEICTNLNDYGVNCGTAKKPTTKQLIVKTKPLIQKFLKDRLKLNIKSNSTYSQNDYLKLLVHSSITKNYAEGSSNQLKAESDIDCLVQGCEPNKRSCPAGDTVLYHIKKFNENELYSVFDGITDAIIRHAIRARRIPRWVTVAIDFTDISYYGEKTDPMVVGKDRENGTNYAHRYATITIVEGGVRYTLKTLAVGKMPMHIVVEKLIFHARKLVNIRYVLLDRGFYTVDVLTILKKADCKYVIPGKKTTRVENLIRKNDVPSLIRYRVGNNSKYTYTNLVIVNDREGNKCTFITNIENMNTTSEIFKTASALYSKRWGIETTYRVTKHSFLSKTTSKNPIVRLFYYLLAVSLYNLWQLANMIIPEVNNLKVTKYESQSRIFGSLLKGCLRMLDTGPPHNIKVQLDWI